jgi:site-specific recombinase XerD
MTPMLTAAMRDHFAAYRLAAYAEKGDERSPWVFHHQTRRRHYKAGARIASFDRAAKNAAARAKLPNGFRLHDLRHRRVTTWLAEGANAVHVKEAVGHADVRATMGYTHLAREHLRSLVAPSSNPAAAKPQARKSGATSSARPRSASS